VETPLRAEKDEFSRDCGRSNFMMPGIGGWTPIAAAGKLDFLVREADEAIDSNTLRDWPLERKE
jgi:hypothetical protein